MAVHENVNATVFDKRPVDRITDRTLVVPGNPGAIGESRKKLRSLAR
jgi:hypothetical protein